MDFRRWNEKCFFSEVKELVSQNERKTKRCFAIEFRDLQESTE